MSLDDFGIN